MRLNLPLDDGTTPRLRIVEGSAFIAAPIAGLTLAQLGADVIRVDPIGGGLDYGRWPLAPGGRSLYWAGLNKGKRSIAVDLFTAAGRDLVAALITAPSEGGGIYLSNLQYKWLRYEDLVEKRGDLLMVQMVGDSHGRVAFDYTVNAAAGYPVVTGPPDAAEPVNHVLPAWDLLAGIHAVTGLLAAERRRRATGAGQLIRISLSDVALATVGNLGHIAEAQINGAQRPRLGNYVYGSFGSSFRVRDGRWVMVVAMTPRHWNDLCKATGVQAQIATYSQEHSTDLSEEGKRYEHREAIVAMMDPWFRSRTLEEVAVDLDELGVPWGPYQSFLEMVENDSRCSLDNPLFSNVDHPQIGTHLTPGSPLAFSDSPRTGLVAPLLGENTDEVLAELLALSDAEIGRLHDGNVVAGAQSRG